MTKLSVIILSYNTIDITKRCLDTLVASLGAYPSLQSEIIVIDNASSDGSKDMIQTYKQSVQHAHISFISLSNTENEGFPKGNNRGLNNASGEVILFMNSDVIIHSVDWVKLVAYLNSNNNVGALTVRVELPNKSIDPASHRGFPSIWNSFTYFSKIEQCTYFIPQLRKFFGGYHLTHKDLDRIHTVDAISGAFFMSRKKVLQELNGFDEAFFMYGEDIDLAYRMKEKGYDIVYYPTYTVTHLKYQSGLKQNKAKKRTREYFYNAMRIFYRKHYEKNHTALVNKLVYFFINIKSRI